LPPDALEAAEHAAMPLPGGKPSLSPPQPSQPASGASAMRAEMVSPQAAKAVVVKDDPWSN
jgi:hypothetical protein